ncbi:MAG: chloride channel protein, partial [Oscillospiraceae bacterium]
VFGSYFAGLFGIMPTFFEIDFIPQIDAITLGKVIVLGGLCAVVSYVFCKTIHGATHLYMKYLKSPYTRVFVGGVLVVLLTFALGTTDYNGAGMDVISRAISTGEVVPTAFILKILFTAITLGAGFKGGEIVPAFFTGATFGAFVSQFLGLPCGFGGGLGLIALFCAATNCPLASIFMSIELFGTEGMIYFAVIASVSYMLSGYHGLYSAQKIMYSKYKAEYIKKEIV